MFLDSEGVQIEHLERASSSAVGTVAALQQILAPLDAYAQLELFLAGARCCLFLRVVYIFV